MTRPIEVGCRAVFSDGMATYPDYGRIVNVIEMAGEM